MILLQPGKAARELLAIERIRPAPPSLNHLAYNLEYATLVPSRRVALRRSAPNARAKAGVPVTRAKLLPAL